MEKLFAKALGGRIDTSCSAEPQCKERLDLVIPSPEGEHRRIPFWLFDASHCHADHEKPAPFNIAGICEIAQLPRQVVILATAVARKCRMEEVGESAHRPEAMENRADVGWCGVSSITPHIFKFKFYVFLIIERMRPPFKRQNKPTG